LELEEAEEEDAADEDEVCVMSERDGERESTKELKSTTCTQYTNRK
jgi:hypothetical protein